MLMTRDVWRINRAGSLLIWLWDQADRLPEAYAALEAMCTEPPLVGRRFPFDSPT